MKKILIAFGISAATLFIVAILGGIIYFATRYIDLPLIVATIVIGMAFGVLTTVSVYSFFFYIEKRKP